MNKRETICLNELITKIRENKEIGEIMGNAMIEIAKSCKRVQKEEMPHYKQIRREEVMSELSKNKDIYCAAFDHAGWGMDMYVLKGEKVEDILSMIKEDDTVFYERIKESEETE